MDWACSFWLGLFNQANFSLPLRNSWACVHQKPPLVIQTWLQWQHSWAKVIVCLPSGGQNSSAGGLPPLRFLPSWKVSFLFFLMRGAGIAQWLERRTRDWKVAGSNPCWNGWRIFFSRVDFLCWLLFRYPFHPYVTTVARKKSRSFCQKCRWQVTAKLAYTLRMWLLLNRASALVTTCPSYVKWHLRTLSINSSFPHDLPVQ